MRDFRDAISFVVDDTLADVGLTVYACDRTADRLLMMPELEAIRAALASLTYVLRMAHQSTDDARTVMAAHGLPESVIAWVMDGAK